MFASVQKSFLNAVGRAAGSRQLPRKPPVCSRPGQHIAPQLQVLSEQLLPSAKLPPWVLQGFPCSMPMQLGARLLVTSPEEAWG